MEDLILKLKNDLFNKIDESNKDLETKINSKIDSINGRMDTITGRMDKQDDTIEEIRTETRKINDLSNRLETLEKSMVPRTSYADVLKSPPNPQTSQHSDSIAKQSKSESDKTSDSNMDP